MVFQTFANYAGVEKFDNVNEEIEYFQGDKNKIEYFEDADEEVIEYQTEISEKLREMLREVKELKLLTESTSTIDESDVVALENLEGNLKKTIEEIENKEISSGDSIIKQNNLVKIFNKLKSLIPSNEGFQNNTNNNYVDDEGNDEEGADDEGNDEEGSDAEDAFVVTDDNNEIIEGFQDNNNTIEYYTGLKSLFSLDLLLRSVLYACLFYILAHRDTFKIVGKVLKQVPKSKLIYVHMAVFVVVYYLLNLFI